MSLVDNLGKIFMMCCLLLLMILVIGFIGMVILHNEDETPKPYSNKPYGKQYPRQLLKERYGPLIKDTTEEPVNDLTNETTSDQYPQMPKIQRKLIEIVEHSYLQYENAPNELKKSAIRTQRKRDIAQLFSSNLQAVDWIGILSNMRTTQEGDACITIDLHGSRKISLKATVVLLGEDTTIKHCSPLYNKVSEMSEGDLVKISGWFFKGDKDFLAEDSMTERGSMEAPEFIMKFSDIIKID